jgi:hypothetical protein
MTLNPYAPSFVPSSSPQEPLQTAFPVGGLISDTQEYKDFINRDKTNPNRQGLGYMSEKQPSSLLSSALPGLLGGAAYIGTGIFSSLMQNQTANRALDLEYSKFDRSWKAADEAGLLSPDQFSTLGTGAGYFRNTGAGAIGTKHSFAKSYSSFS